MRSKPHAFCSNPYCKECIELEKPHLRNGDLVFCGGHCVEQWKLLYDVPFDMVAVNQERCRLYAEGKVR